MAHGSLAVAVLALLLPACGYRAGPLVPEGVRTVALVTFDNDTFRREIEVELSRAVAEEIHARTDLRVVAEPEGADLVVRGRILSFDERVLADRGADRITESSVVVVLRVILEDRVAGTRRSLTLRSQEPYSTYQGQRLASARAEAFENLAERIVHALAGEWPEEPPREPS
jgi:hypothetical protein